MTETDTTETTETNSILDRFRGYGVPGVVGLTALVLVAADPTAAQNICENASGSTNRIGNIVNGFFQLTTALGLVGVVLLWQGDALANLFTLSPKQKRGLKRRKSSAMKGALVLLLLGPMIFALDQVIPGGGLPLGGCANVFSWF